MFRYNSECIPDLFGINYVTILLLSLIWNFELKSLYSVITMMIRRDRKPEIINYLVKQNKTFKSQNIW